MSQSENSDLTKELENKDDYKVKYKNIEKNIEKKKTMSQVENDSMEKSENEDIHKVKYRNKHIRKKIKMSQYSDSNSVKELDKDAHRIKCKDKNMWSIKISQNGSDSTEESENKHAYEVKSKNKDIRSKINTSENKNNDSMYISENEDIEKRIKISQNKNKKNKYTDNVSSRDENVEEEYCVEATHLIHKVKYKNKNIQNEDEDNNSMEILENKDIHKVKYKGHNIQNVKKVSEDEDSDSMEKSENENVEIKCKVKDIGSEDIGNRMKTLHEKNHDSKKFWESKYIHRVKNKSGDESVEEYCSEVTYLARQMASAERPCQTEIFKLYNLKVQLRHTVPPQHMIETRAGSHMPTRKEIEEFEKIIPIKKGSYSFEEDNIIANNWKTFCKIHNWDVNKSKPFLRLRIGNLTYMRNTGERRKFVQFLANGLPERTLYSVYHRFKNLYENNLQRRFKPEEDEMIIDHLENNPALEEKRKYADLAKVLQRTRHSIWRRYRILNKKRSKKDD
ncbi:hypothetical protein ALC56_15235 [Trachymyrmex septentrionalis]|uniref:Uncharacterized protein n=1 Tax=Trachymyrmex septentrionalis TaxID=34720 RepID=A0A195ERN5_9HYME|nr:hypothetical protein ALC56_15235 [Trachymyrmex septentrionalis]